MKWCACTTNLQTWALLSYIMSIGIFFRYYSVWSNRITCVYRKQSYLVSDFNFEGTIKMSCHVVDSFISLCYALKTSFFSCMVIYSCIMLHYILRKLNKNILKYGIDERLQSSYYDHMLWRRSCPLHQTLLTLGSIHAEIIFHFSSEDQKFFFISRRTIHH